MSPLLKRRLAIGFGLVAVVYVGFFVGTTTVQPQGTGGLSGPLHVRMFKSEKHLMAFYPLYLVERWIRNRSFCYASSYFNVDFEDGHYERDWLYGDGKYSRIWYDPDFGLFGLLANFVGRSEAERKLPAHSDVEVSPGLPASVSNAVLRIIQVTPTNATPTTYREKTSGHRSLGSPVGSGGDSVGHYHENRLLAIRAEGFLMLFTSRDGGVVQTNVVLFRYGEVTETNTLGWKIVGQFKSPTPNTDGGGPKPHQLTVPGMRTGRG